MIIENNLIRIIIEENKDYRESPSSGSQIIINNIISIEKQKIELDNGFKYEIII